MADTETMDFESQEASEQPLASSEDFTEESGFENDIDMDEEFRGRGRGFRAWSGTGPRPEGPRFRGRGYGPGGPPSFRGRGGGGPMPLFNSPNGPRNGSFNGPPNFNVPPNSQNWTQQPNFAPPSLLSGPPSIGTGPPPLMGSGAAFPSGSAQQPPALDMNAEIWVEAKSPEGKAYYYNARTRETTWTKPEGANIKVIMQDQVEAMAQAAGGTQMPPGTTTAAQAALAQANITNKPETGDDEANQLEKPPNGMPNLMQGPPPGMARFPAPGAAVGQFPQFGMPPPGFQGASWPPTGAPWAAGPPGATAWGIAPGLLAGMSSIGSIDEASIMAKVDPEIVAKGTEWTEHKAPDGRFYYYHAKKGESVWEKPQEMKDLETAKLAAAQGISTRPMETVAEDGAGKQEQVNGEMGSQVQVTRDEMGKNENEKPPEDALLKKEDEPKAKEAKVQDKSRPVSSTAVPGTPWCVVWTGDSRVFFYNPSSRSSVWERPEDLQGRSDVNKMVAHPPNSTPATGASDDKDSQQQIKDKAAATAKRSGSDESESDEEEVPAKKSKTDEGNSNNSNGISSNTNTQPPSKKIDIGKEAAMEAEVRAAKERAVIPLDTRINSFKEMLAEKEVSAFSTWEKELHKIVFDHRYLLLTSKERKQVFEKYVKERAEDERREKRNKLRERKEAFKKLMQESHLHGKSSFSDFAQKFSKDERFKAVEKMRDREGLFNEFLIEVRRREKEEKSQRREMVKKEFFSMLKEQSDLDRHARWSDVKKKFDSDSRYKAVDSSGQREDWWREYCKILKEDRKKAKEKEREHKKDKEKHRRKEKEKERDDKQHERKKSESARDADKDPHDEGVEAVATETTTEQNVPPESEATANSGHEEKTETHAQEGGNQEESTTSDTEKEQLAKEKERQARAVVSMREREKEVQRTLATHMRDRDKEREQHKRDEAIQHFNALLVDLVRSAELGWKEVKRIIRKDQRWDMADTLSRDEKEKLFNEHIETIVRKKREKFRELLNETPEVTLTSNWKEVKKMIKEDPRYTKFASSERCEREFKDYLKDKLVAAKGQFKELLQETKLITHKSLTTVRENQSHMSEIEEILKNDKRYLVLDFITQERTQLVLNYLEELDRRGPPPPPTASEPSRRAMK